MPDELIKETLDNPEQTTPSTENQPAPPEPVPTLPPNVSVGCSDLPPGLRRKRYFQRLHYLDIRGTRIRVPKNSALDNWRVEAGDNGRFGLYAPQVITDKPGRKGYAQAKKKLSPKNLALAGGFRNTEVVTRSVQSIANACTRVNADIVIFRSPPEFVPSAHNRDTLHAFFNDVAPQELFGDTARVWEPTGLWESASAARFAADHQLVLACDPLSNDPLAGTENSWATLPTSQVYFQITGLGKKHQRFDEYALEPLFDLITRYERAWVVFSHDHKYPDAIRCHRLLAELAAG